jgi:predicted nucleotidyltransferase
MSSEEIISVMTGRIVAAFDPEQVILFGSQARGDAGPHSDIDLLVVVSEVGDKRQMAVQIRQALADLPAAKDVFVATPEDIQRRGHLVGSVLCPALREGKVLCKRP